MGLSLPWAVAISVVAAVAIFSTGGPSDFLFGSSRLQTQSRYWTGDLSV